MAVPYGLGGQRRADVGITDAEIRTLLRKGWVTVKNPGRRRLYRVYRRGKLTTRPNDKVFWIVREPE